MKRENVDALIVIVKIFFLKVLPIFKKAFKSPYKVFQITALLLIKLSLNQ